MNPFYAEKITQWLQKYQVHPTRGFLPATNPLAKLPTPFDAWEQAAAALSIRLNNQTWQPYLAKMPLLKTNQLQTTAQLERAMLLLSCMAHGYVWQNYQSTNHIPASVAIPWVQVAQRLGRPPVVAHASLVLQNWRLLNENAPIRFNNIAIQQGFHGGRDESSFFMLTVVIEATGAKAVYAIAQAYWAAQQKKDAVFCNALTQIAKTLVKMRQLLLQMYEHCDPYIFYHRVRPFLGSLEQIKYEGLTTNPIRSYSGGSAAQSSLLQLVDAAFGIKHEQAHAHQFLRAMRAYMPPKHAAFIALHEKDTTIVNYLKKCDSATTLYQEIINELLLFRNEHLKIVAKYILAHSKKVGVGSTGTGGTNPMIFLKGVRDNTHSQKK